MIRWRPRRLELLLIGALWIFAFFVGSFVSRHFSGRAQFYQNEFGPAVMLASGRGFVNPAATPGSPLDEFLSLRRQTIDPAAVATVPVTKPDQFHYAHRYLLTAAGAIWRVSGISWANLSILSAALFATTIVAGYAICRLWLPWTFALAGALFWSMSPLHLSRVPQVRDYAKAPFILLVLFVTVVICLRPLPRRTIVALSAAAGVIAGVGIGFRMDVSITAPIFLASLFLFGDRLPWTGLATKALAAAAFVLSLALVASPVLTHLSSGGSNSFHAILLGYADSFDTMLGVKRSLYSFLPFYSDGYVETMLRAQSLSTTGRDLVVPSAAYDAAGRTYLLEIVRHFPADAVTRTLAATNGILNMPFNEPGLNFLSGPSSRLNPLWDVLTNQAPHRLRLGAAFEALTMLNGWGVVAGIMVVAAGAVQSVRTGLLSAAILLALPAYASLQFDSRHYFHLEIVAILAVLVALRVITRGMPDRRSLTRFAASVAVLAVVVVMSTVSVRAYQTAHLRMLFEEYADAPRTPVVTTSVALGDGSWEVRVPPSPAVETKGLHPLAYYVVEFDGAPGSDVSAVGLHYRTVSSSQDLSRVMTVPVRQGVNRLFFPAFTDTAAFELEGIQLASSLKRGLLGVYRVTNPERLPVPLDLRLPAGWRGDHLYETLAAEGRHAPDDIELLGSGLNGSFSQIALMDRVESVEAIPAPGSVAVAYTSDVRFTPRGIEMDGAAASQSSYLVEFKPITVDGPATLVAKGHLETGGLVFGLLKDGRWYGELDAARPGDFMGVIDVVDPGVYTPLITNATARDRQRNRFSMSRFGVVNRH